MMSCEMQMLVLLMVSERRGTFVRRVLEEMVLMASRPNRIRRMVLLIRSLDVFVYRNSSCWNS